MNDNTVSAVIVYGGLIMLLILMCVVSRNDRRDRYPQVAIPWKEHTPMELLAWTSLYLLIAAIMFAGFVDILGWITKSGGPSVSSLVHYYLNLYPWVGWVLAGLAYHLLVESPRPPLP